MAIVYISKGEIYMFDKYILDADLKVSVCFDKWISDIDLKVNVRFD